MDRRHPADRHDPACPQPDRRGRTLEHGIRAPLNYPHDASPDEGKRHEPVPAIVALRAALIAMHVTADSPAVLDPEAEWLARQERLTERD